MTDRELLELAAIAIGLGGAKKKFLWSEGEYPRGSDRYGALWNYLGNIDDPLYWNPLADDGDALRLAVKLRLMVDVIGGRSFACWGLVKGQIQRRSEVSEDIIPGADELAATRRAITRAAAEIGRAAKSASHDTNGETA
jgi:hypothetical protein